MESAGLKWPRHSLRAEEVIIWSTGQSTLWNGGRGGVAIEVGFISNSEFLNETGEGRGNQCTFRDQGIMLFSTIWSVFLALHP
jgi:hypothetical protein